MYDFIDRKNLNAGLPQNMKTGLRLWQLYMTGRWFSNKTHPQREKQMGTKFYVSLKKTQKLTQAERHILTQLFGRLFKVDQNQACLFFRKKYQLRFETKRIVLLLFDSAA